MVKIGVMRTSAFRRMGRWSWWTRPVTGMVLIEEWKRGGQADYGIGGGRRACVLSWGVR
jgi:hypothetical protein